MGGIVGSINPDKKTGILVAQEDYISFPNGATSYIKTITSTIKECRYAGYNDWRIPTVDDWKLLYDNNVLIPKKEKSFWGNINIEYLAIDKTENEFEYNGFIFENAKIRKYNGTVRQKIRLIRDFEEGVEGKLPIPVTRIGDEYQGGYVFELTEDGQNGKIIAKKSLKAMTWGNCKKECEKYTVTVNDITYDDWYLPSIDELSKARELVAYYWQNSVYPRPFNIEGVHWSSTIVEGLRAYYDLFFNRQSLLKPGVTSTSQLAYSRPVRKF